MNDPLRAATDGFKSDYIPKIASHSGKKYYPIDNKGNVDEWAAVEKHTQQLANSYADQAYQDKRDLQKLYQQDLQELQNNKKTIEQFA